MDAQQGTAPKNTGIKSFSFIEVIRHGWKWRKFIIAVAFSFSLLGVVVALNLPKYYLASVTIVPPSADKGGLSGAAMAKSLPFDISPSMFGLNFGGGGDIDRYVSILQSTRFRMAIIDSFDLRKAYNFSTNNKKYFIEDVLKAFGKNISVSSSDNMGTVSISVLDTSPQKSALMANFSARMVDSINKDIVRTHLGKKREFLQQRMLENRANLEHCEDSLLAFQKQKGLIDIQQQAIASIQAIGEAETKLLLEEMELSMEQYKFSGTNPRVQERLADLKSMHSQLFKVGSGKDNSVLMSISKIPAEVLAYERMKRSVAIMDFLDKYLTKEYETANLEERSTVPTVAVLDSARVPEKRDRPKRQRLVITFFALGACFGAIGSVALESLYLYRSSLPPGKIFKLLIGFAAFAIGKKK